MRLLAFSSSAGRNLGRYGIQVWSAVVLGSTQHAAKTGVVSRPGQGSCKQEVWWRHGFSDAVAQCTSLRPEPSVSCCQGGELRQGVAGTC